MKKEGRNSSRLTDSNFNFADSQSKSTSLNQIKTNINENCQNIWWSKHFSTVVAFIIIIIIWA